MIHNNTASNRCVAHFKAVLTVLLFISTNLLCTGLCYAYCIIFWDWGSFSRIILFYMKVQFNSILVLLLFLFHKCFALLETRGAKYSCSQSLFSMSLRKYCNKDKAIKSSFNHDPHYLHHSYDEKIQLKHRWQLLERGDGIHVLKLQSVALNIKLKYVC